MAKTKSEFKTASVNDPIVRVRVTKRGNGRISTGQHDVVHGDFLYEEGEEFTIAESIALSLIGEDRDNPDNTKDWVVIVDADAEQKRGPGRPPKDA